LRVTHPVPLFSNDLRLMAPADDYGGSHDLPPSAPFLCFCGFPPQRTFPPFLGAINSSFEVGLYDAAGSHPFLKPLVHNPFLAQKSISLQDDRGFLVLRLAKILEDLNFPVSLVRFYKFFLWCNDAIFS